MMTAPVWFVQTDLLSDTLKVGKGAWRGGAIYLTKTKLDYWRSQFPFWELNDLPEVEVPKLSFLRDLQTAPEEEASRSLTHKNSKIINLHTSDSKWNPSLRYILFYTALERNRCPENTITITSPNSKRLLCHTLGCWMHRTAPILVSAVPVTVWNKPQTKATPRLRHCNSRIL